MFKFKIDKNKLLLPLAGVVLAVSAVTGVVGIANADTTTPSTSTQTSGVHKGTPPAAFGTVTAVSGDTITLTDKKNSTTYTVDATNATITKRSAPTTQGAKPTSTTITVSDIAVGDMISVQGTVSGTNITATKISDGVGGFGGGRGPGGRGPGVMGTVASVNGSTITVTGKNGTTYTVDASNSTVGKFETIPVSSIQVGDTVGIQGTVSGDSVTAKSIMDGIPTQAHAPSATTSS